ETVLNMALKYLSQYSSIFALLSKHSTKSEMMNGGDGRLWNLMKSARNLLISGTDVRQSPWEKRSAWMPSLVATSTDDGDMVTITERSLKDLNGRGRTSVRGIL